MRPRRNLMNEARFSLPPCLTHLSRSTRTALRICIVLPPAEQDFFKEITDWLRNEAGEFIYLETREEIHTKTEQLARKLHTWIAGERRHALKTFSEIAGLTFETHLPGLRSDEQQTGVPKFQVS